MPKVIQIRDVPDKVHDTLARAAAAERLSLNRYVLRELDHLARRAEMVHHNLAVIRETQDRIPERVAPGVILEALREGRDE